MNDDMSTMQALTPAKEAINETSLDGDKPLFKTNRNGLPIFLGKTYEDHVDAFQGIDRSVDARLWALASVAASLKTRYNDQTVQKFAHEVRHSAVYIYELAATYRKFENSTRVEILSFTHHRIAARAKDP